MFRSEVHFCHLLIAINVHGQDFEAEARSKSLPVEDQIVIHNGFAHPLSREEDDLTCTT